MASPLELDFLFGGFGPAEGNPVSDPLVDEISVDFEYYIHPAADDRNSRFPSEDKEDQAGYGGPQDPIADRFGNTPAVAFHQYRLGPLCHTLWGLWRYTGKVDHCGGALRIGQDSPVARPELVLRFEPSSAPLMTAGAKQLPREPLLHWQHSRIRVKLLIVGESHVEFAAITFHQQDPERAPKRYQLGQPHFVIDVLLLEHKLAALCHADDNTPE